MAIVTIDELKEQLNLTEDLGAGDDALLARKLDAAQGHIERLLGFKIAVKYPQPADVPAPLKEAVMQLASHWFENREATIVGVAAQELPFGVWPIVNEYREYYFG